MKRIIASVVFMILLPACFADEVIPLKPMWEEFCPPKYQLAKPVDEPGYNRGAYISASMVPGLSLIALPLAARARKKQEEAQRVNYWSNRRVQFDSEIGLCAQTNTDKAMCYMQIRQMESQKNDQHAQSQQLDRIRRSINASR